MNASSNENLSLIMGMSHSFDVEDASSFRFLASSSQDSVICAVEEAIRPENPSFQDPREIISGNMHHRQSPFARIEGHGSFLREHEMPPRRVSDDRESMLSSTQHADILELAALNEDEEPILTNHPSLYPRIQDSRPLDRPHRWPLQRNASDILALATLAEDGMCAIHQSSQLPRTQDLTGETHERAPRRVSEDKESLLSSLEADDWLALEASLDDNEGVSRTHNALPPTHHHNRSEDPHPQEMMHGFAVIPDTDAPTEMEPEASEMAEPRSPGIAPRKKKPAKTKRTRNRRKDPDEKVFVDKTDRDVLLGRGGESNHHPGNIAYRQHVLRLQPLYKGLTTKEKTAMTKRVVDWVKHEQKGRFLQRELKDPGQPKRDHTSREYYEVTDITARQKVSQALREDHTPEGKALKKLKSKPRKSRK